MGIMNNILDNSKKKIDEALFYLALMDRIEIERSSLTKEREAKIEFSYLLSAFLNACYSCTEHLKQNAANKDTVRSFREKHPDFYASGSKGGWRTQAVHFRPVEPEHDGYIPPPGDNIIMRFRDTKPYIPPPGNAVDFSFGSAGRFYFSASGAQNSICDLCAIHLGDLKTLVDSCH